VFGDNIDTDQLAPGGTLKSGIEVIASQCMGRLNPKFATDMRPGDFVIGGRNFGIGSSREQAAHALCHLGVAAVIAQSFGGIFYRNAFNYGLMALVCPDASAITQGERLEIDPEKRTVKNLTRDETYICEAIPSHLVDIVRAGGLVPYLEANRR
jgi:3-isopropylmalate/(R)-2-methylmalate dehydratase small subunit